MTTLTVLASAMVLLTSCLGEGGSETSLYGIAGVVESQPLTYKKVVRISDGSLIYSPGLDSDASIQPGDCCLIDMYIDYSVQNVEQLVTMLLRYQTMWMWISGLQARQPTHLKYAPTSR